ncbi:MAG: molybdopterin-dependent oxidoreductase [Planctomycetota bacterium]
MIERTRTTACPLDCPDTCGVQVVTGPDGSLQRLRGNPDHAWSQGSLCGKTAIYHEVVHAPGRLAAPLVRSGDGFRETSWEEALGVIARRMDGIDGDDVLSLNYAGNMGLVQRRFPMRLMHSLGARFHDNGVCDATAEAGFQLVNGRSVGPDLDAEATPDRCDLFVLWGSDAKRTAPHLMSRLKRLAEAGVGVIVLDIYRTETIRKVEEWGGRGLVVHPGSDGALALGLAMRAFDERAADLAFLKDHCAGAAELRADLAGAWPLERVCEATGLDAEAVVALSDALHAAEAPLLRTGVGFARRRNGGENMRAIASLAAVLGASDRIFFQTGDHFGLDDDVLARPDLRSAPVREPVSQVGLGRILDEGAFRAAFVWGHNPAATLPDAVRVKRGLERDDLFVVVHELFLTETAKRADVVLPATALTEHSDVFRSYGHRTLQVGRRATEAPAEQRSNVACFGAIGRALGFSFEADEDDLVDEFLRANRERFTGDEYERLVRGEAVQLAPRAFEDRGTPSGRIELSSDRAEAAGLPRVATYTPDDGAGMRGTFQLVSAPSTATHNSTYLHVPRHRERLGAPVVHAHPDDVAPLGLAEGDRARVRSEYGAVTLTLRLDPDLARKMLRIDGFLNEDLVPEGAGVNALTSPDVSDHGGGNVLYSARVEIEAAEDEA